MDDTTPRLVENPLGPKTVHETLWSAKTEDNPPLTLHLIDDSPDGLSIILHEGDTELGVTVSDEDVKAIGDVLARWRFNQSMKIVVTERITDE
jgi:hypothetical protein